MDVNTSKQKAHVLEIFQAAINAVMPNNLICSIMKKDSEGLWIAEKCYSVKSKRISLVGFGKAVVGMARTVQDILGEELHSGILSAPIEIVRALHKAGKSNLIPIGSKIKIYEGAENNLPDKASEKAAEKILTFVQHLDENDLLIILVSGGGSALLPAPKPPITLEEKLHLTKLLANRGATIQELNTVRRMMSNIKGGKLALAAKPAQVITLILSDVIGDSLDQIASGPTVPTQDDPGAAKKIFEKYGLMNDLALSVQAVLDRQESTDHSNNEIHYNHVTNHLIGSNATALRDAQRLAHTFGYAVFNLSTTICGEAYAFGRLLAEITEFVINTLSVIAQDRTIVEGLKLKGLKHGIPAENLEELQLKAQHQSRLAILSGGETVVHVLGNGIGGRNQETALAYSIYLHKIRYLMQSKDYAITFLSAGTDGQDGPTNAAGAIAYPRQLNNFQPKQDIPEEFLLNNNSNAFFQTYKPEDLVITGITGTNVMDIHIILIEKKPII